jgi:hypothetical protein
MLVGVRGKRKRGGVLDGEGKGIGVGLAPVDPVDEALRFGAIAHVGLVDDELVVHGHRPALRARTCVCPRSRSASAVYSVCLFVEQQWRREMVPLTKVVAFDWLLKSLAADMRLA